MNVGHLYKQIEEMIYEDTDKAEKMLLDSNRMSAIDNGGTTDLLIKLGAELWVKDRTAKAKKILNIALVQADDNDYKAEALEYIARCYNDENKFDKAIELYRKIISLTRNSFLVGSAYQGIASILYNLDKKKKALRDYLISMKYFDKNDPKCSDSVDISISKIIHLYLYFGDMKSANVYIDEIINDPKSSHWVLCETYYDLAHYHYRKKDWAHALENYKLAFSYFDKEDHDILADMYSYIGDCYYNFGELDVAKENYQKSLEYTKDEDKERLKHRKDSIRVINDIMNKAE